jgi:hypothetical protein
MTCQPRTTTAYGLKKGLLWDDAGDGDLASKVEAAAQRYEEKFGVKPDTCHVHPDMLPKQISTPAQVDLIKVLGDASILPNHLWVGKAGRGADGREWRSTRPCWSGSLNT